MNVTSVLITISIGLFSIAQMILLFYMKRKQRLKEREDLVNYKLSSGAFDDLGQCTTDGFIFCSVWRISHIINRGRAIGVFLSLSDCSMIVNDLKKGFDPEIGINYKVIDEAINKYCMEHICIREWENDNSIF